MTAPDEDCPMPDPQTELSRLLEYIKPGSGARGGGAAGRARAARQDD